MDRDPLHDLESFARRVLHPALLLAGMVGGALAQVPRSSLVSSTSQPRTVALLDGGALVAVAMDVTDEHVALLSTRAQGTQPVPVWRSNRTNAHGVPQVVASADGTIIATLAQYLVPGSTIERTTVVQGHRAHESRDAWSYTFPGTTTGRALVAITRDGRNAVAARQQVAGPVELAHIDTSTGQVHALPLVFTDGLRRLAFSADGSRLLVSGGLDDHVVDLATGFVTRIGSRSASTDAVALSGDGRRCAFAGFGQLTVLEERAGTWQTTYADGMPSHWFGTQLVLTDDGNQLALAYWNTQDQVTVNVQMHDLRTSTRTWEQTYRSASTFQNLPVALRFDDGGTRLAFAQWGDDGGPVPEVLVFDAATGQVLFAEELPGSPLAIDLSNDARVLCVAAKPVHANRFALGGDVHTYDLVEPIDDVEGVPRLGATIRLRAPGDRGSLVAFLVGLPGPPLALLGIAGDLQLMPTSFWSLGVTLADATGDARLPVDLPLRVDLAGFRPNVQAFAVSLLGVPTLRPRLAPLILR